MSKICCFAGHGDMRYSEKFYRELKATIDRVIEEENITEFWVGDNGNFDKLVARAMRKVKKEYPHIKRYLVVRNFTREVMEKKRYYLRTFNGISRTYVPVNVGYPSFIMTHHVYIANAAAVLICFVSHPGDSAAGMLACAEEMDVKIINLAKSKEMP